VKPEKGGKPDEIWDDINPYFPLDIDPLVFETEQEFNAFLKKPDYNKNGNPGVCFGVYIKNNIWKDIYKNGTEKKPYVDFRYFGEMKEGINPGQSRRDDE
jgi:hypothetical protein